MHSKSEQRKECQKSAFISFGNNEAGTNRRLLRPPPPTLDIGKKNKFDSFWFVFFLHAEFIVEHTSVITIMILRAHKHIVTLAN